MAHRKLTALQVLGRRRMTVVSIALVVVLALGISLFANHSTMDRTPGLERPQLISIVTAENFWGSIASSIGGRFVNVESIISNPNIDPHSYEPTAADARALAGANIAVVNGVGYDPWATRLLAADTVKNVINVGTVLHLADGANPHRWYNPGDVNKFINTLVAVLSAQQSSEHRYFVDQADNFLSKSLANFHQIQHNIEQQFSNVPVGASESIFAMLAPSLDLRPLTPPSFLRAVSEGGDISPVDLATINRQITMREIWVYVYNRQNATPDIQRQLDLCRSRRIPIVSITETMQPATTTFAKWQTSQLSRLYSALTIAKAQRTHG